MISVGEKLRTAREKKGLSISDVAVMTRITPRFIGAIEADDLSSLPGGFFYKSFVQQYASAVGIDNDELREHLDQVFQPEDSRVVEVKQSATNAPSLGTIGPSSRWDLLRNRTGFRVVLLVAMIAACSGLYMLWTTTSHSSAAEKSAKQTLANVPPPPESVPSPAGQEPVQQVATQAKSEPPKSEPPKPEQSSAAQPEPSPAQQQAQAATPPAAVPQSEPAAGNLTVASSERAWVDVTAGGKTLFVGVIEPDQPKSFQVAGGGKLLTGNAGALNVSWEGKSVGSLGPRGQVRTVVLSPGKAEIQLPTKKPVDATL